MMVPFTASNLVSEHARDCAEYPMSSWGTGIAMSCRESWRFSETSRLEEELLHVFAAALIFDTSVALKDVNFYTPLSALERIFAFFFPHDVSFALFRFCNVGCAENAKTYTQSIQKIVPCFVLLIYYLVRYTYSDAVSQPRFCSVLLRQHRQLDPLRRETFQTKYCLWSLAIPTTSKGLHLRKMRAHRTFQTSQLSSWGTVQS